MNKPSAAQSQVIRYFVTGERPTVRVAQSSYRVCEEKGWIERIDTFPFHKATSAGRQAIRMESKGERHGTCEACFGEVHEYPFGWRHVFTPLVAHSPIPVNVC